MRAQLISVVLPCHNEEENLKLLIPEIIKYIPKKYHYEILCVDDGSSDNTFTVIKKFSRKNRNVKGISFHRNFGHSMALLAGIRNASGDAIITMDADFQHPPKMITEMIKEWQNGHDVVRLIKKERDKSTLRDYSREIGYKIWQWASAGTISPGGSDFRLINKKVASYLIDSEEREIFLRGLIGLSARNPKDLYYKVQKRKYGKTSYTPGMNFNVFINGFVSFSTFPIRVVSAAGLILAITSATLLGLDIVRALIFRQSIARGYTTLIFLILILNGFMFFFMGILGEYIGVVFREVKKRPKYIIGETINTKAK